MIGNKPPTRVLFVLLCSTCSSAHEEQIATACQFTGFFALTSQDKTKKDGVFAVLFLARNMSKINDPISVIKGVGEKKAQAFASVGINTVRDVVEYYPTRYEYYR